MSKYHTVYDIDSFMAFSMVYCWFLQPVRSHYVLLPSYLPRFLYYYVLLCTVMYFYVILCTFKYYYELLSIIMYYYVLLFGFLCFSIFFCGFVYAFQFSSELFCVIMYYYVLLCMLLSALMLFYKKFEKHWRTDKNE